jgi:hypothetical protein
MTQNIKAVGKVETPTPEGNNAEALTTGENVPIVKPGKFNLDKFRSKREPTIANVETLQSPLPIHNLAAAKDFGRLHHDEENYWSNELCFIRVPIQGQKSSTLHLIEEDIAIRVLESGDILRFRLALASKPNDVFFLCIVPTQNLDNSWNNTNLHACELAKTRWVKITSQKGEGIENYKIQFARDSDAFSDPNWPKQPLSELIERAFAGYIIETEDHPGLKRKIGAKQSLS